MNPRKGLTRYVPGDGVSAPKARSQNELIAQLPVSEFEDFCATAELVACAVREEIFEPGEKITRVLFPSTGMISIVSQLKDGTMLEAMTVGREGFLGLPLFHGLPATNLRAMCQIPGEFHELKAADFSALVDRAPRLRMLLHRYSQFAHEVVAQTAACNSIHLLEQRCARWLLTTADAIARTSFPLTQEFLSQMLGVRRPGVTMAIGGLVRQGFISHQYGKLSLLDIEGLSRVSCECFATLKERARAVLDQDN
ncbi:MAG: Crp/Fnr family transcriptional regulator [Gemmatimonadaceae bacterium]